MTINIYASKKIAGTNHYSIYRLERHKDELIWKLLVGCTNKPSGYLLEDKDMIKEYIYSEVGIKIHYYLKFNKKDLEQENVGL